MIPPPKGLRETVLAALTGYLLFADFAIAIRLDLPLLHFADWPLTENWRFSTIASFYITSLAYAFSTPSRPKIAVRTLR